MTKCSMGAANYCASEQVPFADAARLGQGRIKIWSQLELIIQDSGPATLIAQKW